MTLSDAAARWFVENHRRLPRGVTVQTFYDQAELVRASAGSVRDSLLVGGLLAILVVILFLRSLRLGPRGGARAARQRRADAGGARWPPISRST